MSTASELAAVENIEDAAFDVDAAFRAHYAGGPANCTGGGRPGARGGAGDGGVFEAVAESEGPGCRTAGDGGRRERYETLFGLFRAGLAPATPEQIHAATEEQEGVRRVLASLGRKQAELLILRSYGCGYDDVARILGLNARSVGTLLRRAQETFRKEYVKRYGHE